MIALNTFISGSSRSPITGDNKTTRAGTKPEVKSGLVNLSDHSAGERSRKMEFMYCIPDLEGFIDRTIKKCLLEYDLDANDTEAVLDDMEKAWPKSPLGPSDKQVLKDCNDNTEKECSSEQVSEVSQIQEAQLLGGGKASVKDEDIALPPDKVKDGDEREVAERQLSKGEDQAEVVTNGKKEFAHVTVEGGDRSDTSSPDVGDGKMQTQRPSKLKSRLQQRYFQGQESSDGGKEKNGKTASDEKANQSWDTNKHLSSNLELLASAANIHTEAVGVTEEHRMQAIRRLQEESERRFQEKSERGLQEEPERRFQEKSERRFQEKSERRLQEESERRFQEKSVNESRESPVNESLVLESTRSLPAQQCLMSSSSSLYSNRNSGVVCGPDGVVCGPEGVVCGPDGVVCGPDGVVCGPEGNRSQKIPSPGSGQTVAPSKSLRQDGVVIIMPRPQEKSDASNSENERVHQLIQQYQNGYHTLIPREATILRRSPDDGGVGVLKGLVEASSSSHSSLPRDKDADRVVPAAHFHSHAISSYNQVHKQINQHAHQPYTDVFLEPFHYHGSRIANIIAEELQKDDNCESEPKPRQNIPSMVRIVPADMVHSAAHEPTGMKLAVLGSYRRAASNESVTSPSKTTPAHTRDSELHYAASRAEYIVTRSAPATQLLPAHTVMADSSSGSPILASHLGHISSGRTNGIINKKKILSDDDQPQDLSVKARKNMEAQAVASSHSFHSSVLNSSEKESKELLLNPSSLWSCPPVIHFTESHSLQKTASSGPVSGYKIRSDVGPIPIKKSRSWASSNMETKDSDINYVRDDNHSLAKRKKLNDAKGFQNQETAAPLHSSN